jgi:hypothetical protein
LLLKTDKSVNRNAYSYPPQLKLWVNKVEPISPVSDRVGKTAANMKTMTSLPLLSLALLSGAVPLSAQNGLDESWLFD